MTVIRIRLQVLTLIDQQIGRVRGRDQTVTAGLAHKRHIADAQSAFYHIEDIFLEPVAPTRAHVSCTRGSIV